MIGRGLCLFVFVLGAHASDQEASSDGLLDLLSGELSRHFEVLSQEDPPVYHLGYTVSDIFGLRVAGDWAMDQAMDQATQV